MYLYDSFTGFEKDVLDEEINQGNTTESWAKWFEDTSVELVKDYIANENKTFIRKVFSLRQSKRMKGIKDFV